MNHQARLNAPDGMRIGDRFAKEVAFTAEAIRAFASAIGDTNPLHHDEAVAAASPFGRIIASGAHSFSLMLAVVPDYLKAWTPNVGLEASVRLLRPVHAGDRAQAEWEVTDIADAPKLKGWIVTVSGRLMRHDGVVALTGVSKSLIYWPSARPPPQRLAG
ncbi:MAG: MaoC family dehydratase [Xanthobacteraceae bacterium]